MARPSRRFTVYDMMEDKGVFDSNPANTFSRGEDGLSLYKGPIQYPKMLYHPLGESKVSRPGEVIATPLGPKTVGEQRELIYKVAADAAEEKKLLAEGWHTSPAKAMAAAARARGEEVPEEPEDPAVLERDAALAAKDAELAELRRLLAEAQTRSAELEMGLPQGPKTGPMKK